MHPRTRLAQPHLSRQASLLFCQLHPIPNVKESSPNPRSPFPLFEAYRPFTFYYNCRTLGTAMVMASTLISLNTAGESKCLIAPPGIASEQAGIKNPQNG